MSATVSAGSAVPRRWSLVPSGALLWLGFAVLLINLRHYLARTSDLRIERDQL